MANPKPQASKLKRLTIICIVLLVSFLSLLLSLAHTNEGTQHRDKARLFFGLKDDETAIDEGYSLEYDYGDEQENISVSEESKEDIKEDKEEEEQIDEKLEQLKPTINAISPKIYRFENSTDFNHVFRFEKPSKEPYSNQIIQMKLRPNLKHSCCNTSVLTSGNAYFGVLIREENSKVTGAAKVSHQKDGVYLVKFKVPHPGSYVLTVKLYTLYFDEMSYVTGTNASLIPWPVVRFIDRTKIEVLPDPSKNDEITQKDKPTCKYSYFEDYTGYWIKKDFLFDKCKVNNKHEEFLAKRNKLDIKKLYQNKIKNEKFLWIEFIGDSNTRRLYSKFCKMFGVTVDEAFIFKYSLADGKAIGKSVFVSYRRYFSMNENSDSLMYNRPIRDDFCTTCRSSNCSLEFDLDAMCNPSNPMDYYRLSYISDGSHSPEFNVPQTKEYWEKLIGNTKEVKSQNVLLTTTSVGQKFNAKYFDQLPYRNNAKIVKVNEMLKSLVKESNWDAIDLYGDTEIYGHENRAVGDIIHFPYFVYELHFSMVFTHALGRYQQDVQK